MKKLTDLTPEGKRELMFDALKWCYDDSEGFPEAIVNDPDGQICAFPWPSLDAMAVAEAALSDDDYSKFTRHIDYLAGQDLRAQEHASRHSRRIISPTASQRLDAWLIAKGITNQ